MKINILPNLLCHDTKAHSPNTLPEKKIPESLPKNQRYYLTPKFPLVKAMFFFFCFSSSHVWMWELDHKEGWVPKNWCFQIVVLEKTLESFLKSKEIKPVNPKENQPWMLEIQSFIGRTDAEAEAPTLWPPDEKSQLFRKDADAGKDWGQEAKGTTENEMAGWHHWLDGHEFEQAPGDGEGQGGLAHCSPWGCKESDMTEHVNNNNFLRRVNKTTIIVPRKPCCHPPTGRGRELRVKAAGWVQPQYHFPFAAICTSLSGRKQSLKSIIENAKQKDNFFCFFFLEGFVLY